jgi:hypothetical protein
MEKKYYIKVITGFREDQYEIIPMQEAHKAYYLFKNPEERGVFENGVALIGKNIQEIKPAWHETMGYNPTYRIESEDWNIIEKRGIGDKMKLLISKAKEVGDMISENPNLIKIKLGEILKQLPTHNQIHNETKQLSDSLNIK